MAGDPESSVDICQDEIGRIPFRLGGWGGGEGTLEPGPGTRVLDRLVPPASLGGRCREDERNFLLHK